MARIRRPVRVGCLLTLALLAPLAAAGGAVGIAAADGDPPGADGDSSAGDWAHDRALPVDDAVRNATNETTTALENATDATLDAVDPNGSDGADPDRDDRDGLADGDGLDGAPPLARVAGDAESGSPTVLRPELPRLSVTDAALVVEVRTVSLDGPPRVAFPLVVGASSNSSSDDTAVEEDGTASSGGDHPPATDPTPISTRTPDANGSVGADADAGGGADGVTSGDGGDPGPGPGTVPEFAPPLGTALLVVAARPWLGLLSGAAAAVANWLENAAVVLRYGRHDGSDPLEHETRERIHERVSAAPGRTLTELSEALDTPLSTVRHHVKVLERERVVVSRKLRGNRRLYPLGAEHAELAAALHEESSAAVLAALHDQGRATVGEVVDHVEKSYSTVSYHLSRLADEGLVVQEREGRRTVSRLAPDVESLLEAPDDRPGPGDRAGREASAD